MENKFERALSRISDRKLRTILYVVAFGVIGFILPWWSIILVAALIGWCEQGLHRAALAALMSCFIAWFLITFALDVANGFRISTRLGGLVGLPIPVAANILSATLGGLLAALAAATINQLKIVIHLLRTSR